MRAKTPFDVTPALARAIADRRTGVGCDQLIVLEPSERADLRMRIWNSDGGEVESCGNATRCVVQLTGAQHDRQRRRPARGRGPRRRGRGQHRRAALRLGRDPARLCRWTPPRCRWRGTGSNSRSRSTSAIRTSSSSSPTRARCRWTQLGPRIENDPAFPERINVNVATYVDDRLEAADLRTRRRRDARLRHRRLRERGRGDRHQARAIAGHGRHDRRQPDHRLGAGRADPHARRARPTCSSGELDLEALQ